MFDFSPQTPFWDTNEGRKVLSENKVLGAIGKNLPADLHERVFPGQEFIESLWSSYKKHGYGHFFYSLAKELRPKLCVEIGVLQGFSLLTVATVLKELGHGQIRGFDLFERYSFRNEKYENLVERIGRLGVENFASVDYGDAFEVHEEFAEGSVDLLHVDISNDGDVFRKIFKQWSHKVNRIMVFEGGGRERDQVEWMIKFHKAPITKALEEIRSSHPQWDLYVFEPFPSMTVAIKRD